MPPESSFISESIRPSIMEFNDLKAKASQGQSREALEALNAIISGQEAFITKAFNPNDKTFNDNLSLLSPDSSAVKQYRLEANTQDLIMKNEQQTKDNTEKLREQYELIKKNPTKENMAALLNALEHNSNDLDSTLTVRDAVKSKTFSDLKVKESSMGSAINSSTTTKQAVEQGLQTLDVVIQNETTQKQPSLLERFTNFISNLITSIVGTTQKPIEQKKEQSPMDINNEKDVAIKTALFKSGIGSEISVQEAVQKRAQDQLQELDTSKSTKALKVMGGQKLSPETLEATRSEMDKIRKAQVIEESLESSGLSSGQDKSKSKGSHAAKVLEKRSSEKGQSTQIGSI